MNQIFLIRYNANDDGKIISTYLDSYDMESMDLAEKDLLKQIEGPVRDLFSVHVVRANEKFIKYVVGRIFFPKGTVTLPYQKIYRWEIKNAGCFIDMQIAESEMIQNPTFQQMKNSPITKVVDVTTDLTEILMKDLDTFIAEERDISNYLRSSNIPTEITELLINMYRKVRYIQELGTVEAKLQLTKEIKEYSITDRIVLD